MDAPLTPVAGANYVLWNLCKMGEPLTQMERRKICRLTTFVRHFYLGLKPSPFQLSLYIHQYHFDSAENVRRIY